MSYSVPQGLHFLEHGIQEPSLWYSVWGLCIGTFIQVTLIFYFTAGYFLFQLIVWEDIKLSRFHTSKS